MDRIEQGLATPITFTFESGGVAVDPSPNTAQVRVLRSDGTVLVDWTTADDATGTGAFSFLLTPTHTALLDVLTLEWKATLDTVEQTLTSTVEVRGGFYFTISEARAAGISDAKYSAADVVQVRTRAEQAFEDAAGGGRRLSYAWVRSFHRMLVNGSGERTLALPRMPVRSVREASLLAYPDAVATGVDLTRLRVTGSGIWRDTRWPAGAENVVVGYEYGEDQPPLRVKNAVLLLAKQWLIEGPIDQRATSMTATEAGGTIQLLTPGVRGVVFGIPEVDATLEAYGQPRDGAYSVPLSPSSNRFGIGSLPTV